MSSHSPQQQSFFSGLPSSKVSSKLNYTFQYAEALPFLFARILSEVDVSCGKGRLGTNSAAIGRFQQPYRVV